MIVLKFWKVKYLVLIKMILRVLLRADDSASLVNHYTLHCTEVKVRMIGGDESGNFY